jgi:hypothetical protein
VGTVRDHEHVRVGQVVAGTAVTDETHTASVPGESPAGPRVDPLRRTWSRAEVRLHRRRRGLTRLACTGMPALRTVPGATARCSAGVPRRPPTIGG